LYVGAISLQCEVCGREIVGKPHKVIIEGAKMITCNECAKLSSDYWTPESKRLEMKSPPKKKAISPLTLNRSIVSGEKAASIAVSSEDLEVVEGFGLIVRRARERLNLTPEDLGKKIGEKESVIKKIESEKIIPDIRLAMKLEHALKIKILSKPAEPQVVKTTPTSKYERGVTLGEIIHIKNVKRRKERDEGDNSISQGSI